MDDDTIDCDFAVGKGDGDVWLEVMFLLPVLWLVDAVDAMPLHEKVEVLHHGVVALVS